MPSHLVQSHLQLSFFLFGNTRSSLVAYVHRKRSERGSAFFECQLHPVVRFNLCRTFLGRATVPTVSVLHPPVRQASSEGSITIPLLPEYASPSVRATHTSKRDDTDEKGRESVVDTSNTITRSAATEIPPLRARHDLSLPRDEEAHERGFRDAEGGSDHHGATGAGKFASRLFENVQKQFGKGDAVTGSLIVSLEVVENDHEERLASITGKADDHTGGVREPTPPVESPVYAAARFKVATDAAAEKRRRDKEGIMVPRMLSRVRALHDELGGEHALPMA